MKRRGPRTKWQRIIRETVLEILIGAAIGLAFDVIYLVACKVKEVRTLQEIPRLMDDYEFRKELERIREHLDAISKESNTVEVRRNYLISWVTIPSAKIYTSDQLRQIFDLTWK